MKTWTWCLIQILTYLDSAISKWFLFAARFDLSWDNTVEKFQLLNDFAGSLPGRLLDENEEQRPCNYSDLVSLVMRTSLSSFVNPKERQLQRRRTQHQLSLPTQRSLAYARDQSREARCHDLKSPGKGPQWLTAYHGSSLKGYVYKTLLHLRPRNILDEETYTF